MGNPATKVTSSRTIETSYTCIASVYDESGLKNCIKEVELFQRRPASELWLEEGTVQCRRGDIAASDSRSAWIIFQAYCSGRPLPRKFVSAEGAADDISSRVKVVIPPPKK